MVNEGGRGAKRELTRHAGVWSRAQRIMRPEGTPDCRCPLRKVPFLPPAPMALGWGFRRSSPARVSGLILAPFGTDAFVETLPAFGDGRGMGKLGGSRNVHSHDFFVNDWPEEAGDHPRREFLVTKPSMGMTNSMKNYQTPVGVRKANFSHAICAGLLLMLAGGIRATAESDPALASLSAGNKSVWHAYDRYDFIMDEATLAVTPYLAPSSEGDGISDPVAGQRRCVIVVPPMAAAGRPWSWRGCYWNHQPQVEVELLKRGFCIAYISANSTLRPGKEWDAWYSFLVERHGLSPKPSFVGMSRGGEYAYQWATHHPDEVSCIYADNPGGNWDVFMHLAALATNDVPVLHVCGSIDPILGKFTLPMEDLYRDFGARISVLIKEGAGHHPHGLKDVTPIVDFMVRTRHETPATPPDFVGAQFTRSHYYSSASVYQFSSAEQAYVTLRGPVFAPCYDRYQFEQPNVEAFTTVIVPQTQAQGKPWVFRADFVGRDNVVDLALLARGFHIVTGSVPYNAEGPVLSQWNTIYSNLVAHGFSTKPVMEGVGGAAGEAYAWAIANPDKVAGLCVVNPVLHSNLAKTQPLDHLEPLAQAKVRILHIVDPADAGFEANTVAAQQKYQQLGGRLEVITVADQGQRPLVVNDLKPVVDFITGATQ